MHTHEALWQFAAEQRSRGIAESTIRNRESLLRHLADDRDLLALTTSDIRAHLGRKGVKQSSRRTGHAAFAAFYDFAVEEGLRADNPMMRITAPRVPKGKPRPFTAEQIDRMLASGTYRRRRAMILVGYYQGFRVAQIARVHGHDIDLADMTIYTIGKGNKEGILPLHPVIAELSHTMPRDSWWFPSIGGRAGHIRPGTVTEAVADAKARAGIADPHLTAHSLRHSFATELVEAGVDIRVIQELMMHDDIGTTQIYSGVSPRLKRSAILDLPSREIPTRSGRRAA